ncbi:thiol reductant ABC exporter subunit CydD [Neisseria iguanae]|uniref:Thiol reductant ABC exporter subunit CydD n=1 Tax=Neisseria iguanae TaxID=90242 RepID=A0A2P7U1I7_9NEIS|nr:thiol reductant ABC exporter subunit CydD [Neisseria iguanae]PSJ80837.1 thiol reductant ABC exporter subunit CydD [Neisseria iguanae]
MPRARYDNLLRTLLLPYLHRLWLPVGLACMSVALLIAQSALLAHLFADWLNAVVVGARVNREVLLQILPWLMAGLLLRPFLNLGKEWLLQNISLDARSSLRAKLLDALANLGPARHRYGNDGALSTQVLEQVDALDGYISRFYVQSLVAVVTPLAIVVAVFFHSKLAAGLLLLTAPLVPLFMILVGSMAADKNREQLDVLAQLGGRFLDLVRGMPTLRRLRATDWAQKQVAQSASRYQRKTMGVLALAFLSGAVLELFSSLAIALVAVYLGLGLIGVLPWAQGEVPVPYESALFILLLAPEFYLPLRQLGSDYHAKAQAQAAAAALQPLLAHASPTDFSEGLFNGHAENHAPEISLNRVSITDDGRQRLAELSLHIHSGSRIGISGGSGIGKSSLLQALLGFADYQGEILVDGANQRNHIARLQQQTAYLAQSATLMRGTIRHNLSLAKADADEDDMRCVLAQVGLWDVVSCLPQGLDTPLGERGRGLSGGQQQRLSLAQLLLRNCGLWLLDEPCAHLDAQTAAEIYALLDILSRGKTVLLVSHDWQEIDWLDQTVILGAHDGKT